MDSQKKFRPKFSFEFFPPRTPEATKKLQSTQQKLAELKPDFFSVTFGAGGSSREQTLETVQSIRQSTGIEGVPHISCIGLSLEQIKCTVNDYKEAGFKHIIALRGDIPSGTVDGPLRYAYELVELIRKETGDHFRIEVACYPEFHPQASSAGSDLENLKRKINAGANGAITQYFYNVDAYFRFVDNCEKIGIDVPIVPGIMPIINSTQLIRFSKACGAEIPRWILWRLLEFGDDKQAIQEFGIDVTNKLCGDLMSKGAPGLHIYTMNQARASEAIWRDLQLSERTN